MIHSAIQVTHTEGANFGALKQLQMNYKEFKPTGILRDFIQSYFICETETGVLSEDKVFASGCLEIMFNLGTTSKRFSINNNLVTEPDIQLWGQVLKPMAIKSFGKHSMLGIRFFPHSAACFFNESMEQFNDGVFDLEDVIGNAVKQLHEQLLASGTITRKIELIESFLIKRLQLFDKKSTKLSLISSVMHDLQRDDTIVNIEVMASRYGISARYLQKLFLHYSGLTPHLFRKINRFRKSLYLVSSNNGSLTTIAHHCGYFDQSHFIKDFKKFTGTLPSCFQPESSTEVLAILNS